MKTTREKAEAQRRVKLDLVREQIENGTLVIRQMTAEERRRYPARTTPPERHAKLIAELQGQIQPGAMGAALAEDARSRGL